MWCDGRSPPFVGSGAFDDPDRDLWPLLTYPFIDPLRQVESLEQPPAPAHLYSWRRTIIYPVRGLTVKGILPRGGGKNPRCPHLWRFYPSRRQGRGPPRSRMVGLVLPLLLLREGIGSGTTAPTGDAHPEEDRWGLPTRVNLVTVRLPPFSAPTQLPGMGTLGSHRCIIGVIYRIGRQDAPHHRVEHCR